MYWGQGLDYDDYCTDDKMYFNLDFVGKVDNKEVKGSDNEVKGSNSADKFSIFAKLAIMKTDGNEYISSSKLFIILFSFS